MNAISLSRRALCGAFLLLGVVVTHGPARETASRQEQEDENPEFALVPPRVDTARVQLLRAATPSGNALLRVRFARGQRIGPTISIRPGERVVLLRDDGRQGDSIADDGTYSALIHFPTEQFAAAQERLARHAASGRTVPVFRGRQLAGAARPRFVPRDRIRPGSEFVLPPPQGLATSVDPARSLVIRHSQVLNDQQRTWNPCTQTGNAMGVWSFPYLVTQIANQGMTGIAPGDLALHWLENWGSDGTINGWYVEGRSPPGDVHSALDSLGHAGLSQAPFRLMAIVSRVDLRGNGVYGGGTGEGRFIFQAVDPAQNCAPLPFTIILEYALPGAGCPDAQARAGEWIALSNLALGTPAYRNALAALTNAFTHAGARPQRTPNRSALNQLRTNELSGGDFAGPNPGPFPPPTWDMREFRLRRTGPEAGYLLGATVAQTPSRELDPQVVAGYMQAAHAHILNDQYTLPMVWQGSHFRGGAAPVLPDETFFWSAEPSPVIPNLRHKFSLNTCNGCHAAETATRFLHVSSGFANPAIPPLSGFMTGISVADPTGAVTRNFNDLLRREQDLSSLVNSVCTQHLLFTPMLTPH